MVVLCTMWGIINPQRGCDSLSTEITPKSNIKVHGSTLQSPYGALRNNMKTYTAWGKTGTLKELVDDSRCVVTYNTVANRIHKHHWGTEKALTTPSRHKPKIATLRQQEVMAVIKLRWV